MWKYLIALLLVLSACSVAAPTANVAAPSIYEDVLELNPVNQTSANSTPTNKTEVISAVSNEIQSPVEVPEKANETKENKTKPKDEFEFPAGSIVDSQNGLSFSLDDFESELKVTWGKIIRIRSSVLNEYHDSFKPKVIVRLYDSKDQKKDHFKPKAEFDYGINELKQGEHASVDVAVNIAYDDLDLTKKFELVLVDGNVANHRALASIGIDFNALS